MWQNKTIIIIPIIIIVMNCQYLVYCDNSTIHNNSNSNKGDCVSPPCLKCGQNGCQKCPKLIVYQIRQCVHQCPYGHYQRWSTYVDYMGRICIENGNFMGLTTNSISIVIGILIGTVLCLIIIILAMIYLKYKRRQLLLIGNTMKQMNNETNSDVDERRDFLKQLETLRPYAKNYLTMLNDTRKQLRELYLNGDHNAISVYKPVLRDLAKILLLLNCKIEHIHTIPDDWEHLFNWAEQTLKRYKRMSDASLQQQQQVVQLINFLQTPVLLSTDIDNDHNRGSTTVLSTFKPEHLPNSNNNNNNNSNNELTTTPINPQWKFEYSLIDNNYIKTPAISEFNPNLWKNSREFINNSIYLDNDDDDDDDFCQLGFRPQDEITTEL